MDYTELKLTLLLIIKSPILYQSAFFYPKFLESLLQLAVN